MRFLAFRKPPMAPSGSLMPILTELHGSRPREKRCLSGTLGRAMDSMLTRLISLVELPMDRFGWERTPVLMFWSREIGGTMAVVRG